MTALFAFEKEQYVLAHLGAFEWEWKSFGPVHLCVGGRRMRMEYVGYGNVKGTPVVRLVPAGSEQGAIHAIKSLLGERGSSGIYLTPDAYLERVADES